MAKKKNNSIVDGHYGKCPEKINNRPFYGMELDDEQVNFVNAILNKDNLIVFANAKSGTGKTTCALGAADLLVQYGMYEKIVYVTSPVQEERVGFLPGDATAKTDIYAEPLYDAMLALGINPYTAIISDDLVNQKFGTGYIKPVSHVFMRGCNLKKSVVIIDESQNFYVDELKKVLTRISDDCKTIVIGHTGQCDLYKNPENSGFSKYVDHFGGKHWAETCELKTNHRGLVSSWADEL